MIELHHADCRDILARLPPESVDAVVTDPPYELRFMGAAWDGTGIAFDAMLWRAVLRVLKPGGYIVAFGHVRTYHRLACAIEAGGGEIVDQLGWLYGTGKPATAARLKPAWEPIALARKPGPGALNVGACRIERTDGVVLYKCRGEPSARVYGNGLNGSNRTGATASTGWPANIMQDGSPEALSVLGDASRFFYCAKASQRERAGSPHPTQKPVAAMRWLVRLVSPAGGLVLDPFAGSGTTPDACRAEGRSCIGIERDLHFWSFARLRLGTLDRETYDALWSPPDAARRAA